MRIEIIAFLALSTFQVVSACCGNKGCNKSCEPVKLPICWAWDGGYICDNSDGTTTQHGQGNKPKLFTKAEDLIAKTNEVHSVAWESGAMSDKPDGLTNQSKGHAKVTRIGPLSEDDAAMHRAVDGHGKGFFTLNEFLQYLGETKTPELVDYFNQYDVNGDGVITPDEMRLSDQSNVA